MSWYLRIDGKLHGPLDDKRMAQLEFAGKIPKHAEKSQSESGPWVPAIVDDGTAAIEAKRAEQEKYAHLYADENKIVTPTKAKHTGNTSVINSINRHSMIYAVLSTLGAMSSFGYFLENASVIGKLIAFLFCIWFGYLSYHIMRHVLAGSHYFIQRLKKLGEQSD